MRPHPPLHLRRLESGGRREKGRCRSKCPDLALPIQPRESESSNAAFQGRQLAPPGKPGPDSRRLAELSGESAVGSSLSPSVCQGAVPSLQPLF